VSQVTLKSKYREKSGKGVARQLRFAGRVPGVIYGPTIQPFGIELDHKELDTLVRAHGRNPIISLTIEGSPHGTEHLCMIKDIQKDIYQTEILHLDLRRVDLTETIEVSVPITLEGEQVLRAKGGILEQMVRGIRVKTVPNKIPDSVNVDISHLKIGQTVTVGQVQLPEGVALSHDPDAAIVNVFATRGSALFAESST
jgi:large subunit ribosomal protein L25